MKAQKFYPKVVSYKFLPSGQECYICDEHPGRYLEKSKEVGLKRVVTWVMTDGTRCIEEDVFYFGNLYSKDEIKEICKEYGLDFFYEDLECEFFFIEKNLTVIPRRGKNEFPFPKYKDVLKKGL